MKKNLRILVLILFFPAIAYPQEIKVMTYNIRFDNPADGINAWPNRKTKVFELLKKYQPDIIGVQEALKHQLDEIIKALPEYDYIGVGRDDGKTKGEYSAILFLKKKFDAKEENTFWLSETPDVPASKNWDAAITRIVTWARFSDLSSNKEFYLLNTHFDHIGKEARKNSAQILKDRVNNMKGLPAIITGDFNCTRTDPPYKVMTNKEGTVLIDPAPADAPGTFCNFGVNSMECNPIDYIFHTSKWKSRNYEVITDNDGKNYPSDHLPVIVTLQLTK